MEMKESKLYNNIEYIKIEKGDYVWKIKYMCVINVVVIGMKAINFRRPEEPLQSFLIFKIKNLLQLVVAIVDIQNYINLKQIAD